MKEKAPDGCPWDLIWEARDPLGASGYSVEARRFMDQASQGGLRVAFWPGGPVNGVLPWPMAKPGRYPEIPAVSHTYLWHRRPGPPPGTCRVARTMIEGNRLPLPWRAILPRYQAVWVPNGWNREVFVAGGCSQERVFCLHSPEPERAVSPLPAAPPWRILTIADLRSWRRKGMDLLFRAMSRVFSPRDPVLWVIRGRVPRGDWPLGFQDGRGPQVVWETRTRSDEGLRALIRSCHLLVQISRGEGVGLPVREALALGRPVLTVPWSGLEDLKGRPGVVPVRFSLRGLTAPEIRQAPGLAEGLWAEPEEADLVEKLGMIFASGGVLKRLAEEAANGGVVSRGVDVQTVLNRLDRCAPPQKASVPEVFQHLYALKSTPDHHWRSWLKGTCTWGLWGAEPRSVGRARAWLESQGLKVGAVREPSSFGGDVLVLAGLPPRDWPLEGWHQERGLFLFA